MVVWYMPVMNAERLGEQTEPDTLGRQARRARRAGVARQRDRPGESQGHEGDASHEGSEIPEFAKVDQVEDNSHARVQSRGPPGVEQRLQVFDVSWPGFGGQVGFCRQVVDRPRARRPARCVGSGRISFQSPSTTQR